MSVSQFLTHPNAQHLANRTTGGAKSVNDLFPKSKYFPLSPGLAFYFAHTGVQQKYSNHPTSQLITLGLRSNTFITYKTTEVVIDPAKVELYSRQSFNFTYIFSFMPKRSKGPKANCQYQAWVTYHRC